MTQLSTGYTRRQRPNSGVPPRFRGVPRRQPPAPRVKANEAPAPQPPLPKCSIPEELFNLHASHVSLATLVVTCDKPINGLIDLIIGATPGFIGLWAVEEDDLVFNVIFVCRKVEDINSALRVALATPSHGVRSCHVLREAEQVSILDVRMKAASA